MNFTIVHKDGTSRVQTVNEKDKSGFTIFLNHGKKRQVNYVIKYISKYKR